MAALVSILPPLIAAVGVIWFGLMMWAMISILSLAPAGKKMLTYHHLSMWKFGDIRTNIGPAAEPHLRTMRLGAYAFVIVFVVAVAISIVAAVTNSATTGNA
jgi:hypothetical protein